MLRTVYRGTPDNIAAEAVKAEHGRGVEMIRNNSHITGKIIDVQLGCSLSSANYKLRALKKMGESDLKVPVEKAAWKY